MFGGLLLTQSVCPLFSYSPPNNSHKQIAATATLWRRRPWHRLLNVESLCRAAATSRISRPPLASSAASQLPPDAHGVWHRRAQADAPPCRTVLPRAPRRCVSATLRRGCRCACSPRPIPRGTAPPTRSDGVKPTTGRKFNNGSQLDHMEGSLRHNSVCADCRLTVGNFTVGVSFLLYELKCTQSL